MAYYGNCKLLELEALYFIGSKTIWPNVNRPDYLTVPAGVPQGSVLGPLLFRIYISDIVDDIESVIKLFADDTSMYLCLENPHIRAEILNNDLKKIMQWANKWKIEFNERKTELMNISRNKNYQFQYMNSGRTILEDTHSHKHLGIIF